MQMNRILKGFGAGLLILAVLIAVALPALQTTRHPCWTARTLDAVRPMYLDEMRIRRRNTAILCTASAMAGAGLALLLAGFVSKQKA